MKPKASLTWLGLLSGTVALTAYSLWFGGEDEELLAGRPNAGQPAVTATAKTAQPVVVVNNTGSTTTLSNGWVQRVGIGEAASDPFHSARKAKEPEVDPSIQAPPPQPTPPVPTGPPPLPFAYLGKLQRGAQIDIYLDFQGQNLIAHVGETIAGGYRLDSMDAAGIHFTYLASGEKQVLSMGVQP
ncbi:hypothetical protein [Chitinivorax sp. B]|uniref:hypothetical protein n=1 Tax=Chitinivorax sp. B TaxID=2502235 RepID=UPI0010FA3BA6|nr:hypothetical protein [Chitinivorax sp. B]